MDAGQIMSALLLSAADIRALLSPADCAAAVEHAFRESRAGGAFAPAPMHLECDGGGVHAKGATLRKGDALYAAVKVNANFPANPGRNGLPTVQGVLVLIDARNGAVLAVLDSTELTLLRTAAASGIAARYLARKDAGVLAIVGCGAQAAPHVAAVAAALTIRCGFAADLDIARARRFAQHMTALHGIPFEASSSPTEATDRSDIIVTATTATAPILDAADIRPGTFIAAVGADSPHKGEIAPALLARARVVVDSLGQCAIMGDLRHAIAAGAMTAADVHAEIADIVIGAVPGRTREDEIFIFDSTGTALQDVAAASVVYERAAASGGVQFHFA